MNRAQERAFNRWAHFRNSAQQQIGMLARDQAIPTAIAEFLTTTIDQADRALMQTAFAARGESHDA